MMREKEEPKSMGEREMMARRMLSGEIPERLQAAFAVDILRDIMDGYPGGTPSMAHLALGVLYGMASRDRPKS